MAKKIEEEKPSTQPSRLISLKNFFTRRRIIYIIILLLLFVVWRNYRSRQPKFSVELATVTRGNITESLSASGKIEAQKKATLSFQTSGQLVWIGVNEGDSVLKGQALAKLDTTKLNSDFQIASANLRLTQATVAKIHDDLKDHAGDETFAQKVTRTTAEVANDQAYELYIKAQKDLINATLISPLKGIVAKIDPKQIGINVSAFSSNYVVFDPQSVYFSADVNEVEISKLSLTQKVIVTLDAFPDQQFEGQVESISYLNVITSTGATAYDVKIKLPLKNDLTYRLGMNGDAEFITKEVSNTLTIPSTAVIEDTTKKYVYLVDNSLVARKILIVSGGSSVDATQVISGLNEGQIIIMRPPSTIKDGDRVKSLN